MQDGLKTRKIKTMLHNKTRLAEFSYIDYFHNLKLIAETNIRTMERHQHYQHGPVHQSSHSPQSSSDSLSNPVMFKSAYMKKNVKLMKHAAFVFIAASFLCACSSSKRGCPSNGKNVGAEKLLSGEKVPRAKKFKA